MKNINEIIKIEYVKKFLKTLGYEWNGFYYHCDMSKNGFKDEPKKAETFSEMLSHINVTELYAESNKNGQKEEILLYLDFDLDRLFLSAKEKKLDKKYLVSNPKDLTKEWIMFLIENCGYSYVELLSKRLKQQIFDVAQENNKKNEELKKQIEANDKELDSKLKNIENLMRDIGACVEKKKKNEEETF